LSESDFFLTLGDFFWGIGSGRCSAAAYKLAKKRSPLPEQAAARLNAIQKSPFRDKTFVITGDLCKMGRAEALFEVRKRGGLTSDNPVNTMDYLVLGFQEWSDMNGGVASRKVQKAAELQKKGRKVEIISEDDFYSMLGMMIG
jgi:NAD-dependent DNA ligase